jgi:hypothetical protein
MEVAAVARGILYVESRPSSPEQAEQYHAWYEQVHLQEMAALDGIVSARRFAPLDGGPEGPFVAIYEIEADDVAAVRDRLAAAGRSGRSSAPVGLALDPAPTVRFYREIAAYRP